MEEKEKGRRLTIPERQLLNALIHAHSRTWYEVVSNPKIRNNAIQNLRSLGLITNRGRTFFATQRGKISNKRAIMHGLIDE